MTELNIVPECYVDTKVAEIVGQARKYNHQHGCGNVANELKNKLKNNIALGIIDEDKNKGPASIYFLEFNTIKTENNLILKKHTERQQYLVLVCPEIEAWLLNDAKAVGIAPSEFGLPEDMKGFNSISKIQKIDRNIGFHQFIKKLLRENAPAITTLKSWIELFEAGNLDSLFMSKDK
jgi:hypothetical protein